MSNHYEMPSSNASNRAHGDSNSNTQSSPHLASNTRLPIIRTSIDDNLSLPTWRSLLNRAVDQASDASHEWAAIEQSRIAREGYRRHLDMEFRETARRHAERRHAERQQQLQAMTMSTYGGWAPGTTELEHPTRSPPSRLSPRSDHSTRNTATRRYRREQGMYAVSRPEHSHRIEEDVHSGSTTGQSGQLMRPSQHSTSSRPGSTAVGAVSMSESFRRQQRVDLIRDRINTFTGARNNEQHAHLINLLDNSSRLANEWQPTIPNHADRPSGEGNRESVHDEQHITRVFEEAILLLDGLRMCLTQLDRATLLVNAGFGPVNRAEMLANVKILDTNSVFKPQPSSWLRPGARFSGQQKASVMSGMVRSNRRTRRRNEESAGYSNEMTATEASRPWTHGVISAASSEPVKDCWPVKVTITSVDYKEMTLTGTMEAFNVPNAKGTNLVPRDPTISSITTYLEGEIIDLHVHSLKTTNFKAASIDDANYWRKLEPFKSLDINQIVDGFTDMEWLSENIAKQWIIMRWKEKCFVSPSDSNSGLTISGFYYVTLRRSDGKIGGLYHDPDSCPYQHLELAPEKTTVFPLYAFR